MAKSAECSRCPKYDLTAKFVGMVKRDETQRRLIYIAQGADDDSAQESAVRECNYRSVRKRQNSDAAEAALKSTSSCNGYCRASSVGCCRSVHFPLWLLEHHSNVPTLSGLQ